MARTPGFTAVALLMLALGTGANAAMFSVVDAVMLRSPFPSSERVAVVRLARPDGSSPPSMSIDQYRALANPRDVWRMVLAQGVGLVVTGVLFGVAGAYASTRLIASWLYGVTPQDPKTFALSAACMLVIAAVASYIPARRATRIDPLVALRE